MDKGASLSYDGKIPRVTAIARGKLLETMIRIAQQYTIPVYRDPDLAEYLTALKEGSEIPEELYRAVARVLAFCYRVNADFRNRLDHKES
jgi:flagellar biosynthesis protein